MTRLPSEQSGNHKPDAGWWAGIADGLMAAGDQLAVKLADIDDSPWTQQILEQWAEAKKIEELL